MREIKIFTPQELDQMKFEEVVEFYNQLCSYVENLNVYLFNRKDRKI